MKVERNPGPADVSSLFDLRGKLAVLTNVGGGGTAEVARLLSSAGADIVIADRDGSRADATVSELAATGHRAAHIAADIEDEGAVIAAFAHVARSHGRLDILVNCAGMSGQRPLLDTSLEMFDEIQSLNLRANFLCMREGVRQMEALKAPGAVVNVTTIGGMHPVLNGNGVYGAARLGVKALGESVALDYAASGIRVNTLMVGAVSDRTLTHPLVAAELAAGRRMTGPMASRRPPLGQGEMTDVAAAVLYLVSPASRYVTGQSLVVDGGFMIS